MKPGQKTIAFYSTNTGWGGSEVLWWRTALQLASTCEVRIICSPYLLDAARRAEARSAGIKLRALPRLFAQSKPLGRFWAKHSLKLLPRLPGLENADLHVVSLCHFHQTAGLVKALAETGRDFITLTQQHHDFSWPDSAQSLKLADWFSAARANLFVCRHNLELARRQLDTDLPNAFVVPNPLGLVPPSGPTIWSDEIQRNWACVGRFEFHDKGQDLLIHALAQDKWRERGVRLSFFGSGHHRDLMKRMIQRLDAPAEARDFCESVENVWRSHGLCVLGSRAEGLPLSLVEAGAMGRPAVAPHVAGIPEFVTEGKTGYIAERPDIESIDRALERAWLDRENWRALGESARQLSMLWQEPHSIDRLATMIIAALGHTREKWLARFSRTPAPIHAE